MRKTRIGFPLLVVSQFILFAADSSTQQDKVTAWVSITQSKGPQDGLVLAPILLTLGKGVEVGLLSMTIRFPVKLVTFEKVELGGVAEGVGADAKADLKAETDEAVVRLTIATPEKDGARAPLPEGLLANLQFKIAKDAKPETQIPLSIVGASATGAKAGAETVQVETRDGQVFVTNPGVISCFFYMH